MQKPRKPTKRTKQTFFSLIKDYWQILVTLIVLIGWGFVQNYRMDEGERNQKEMRQEMKAGFSDVNREVSDIKVSVGRIEGALNIKNLTQK
jgi:hypothetical protein